MVSLKVPMSHRSLVQPLKRCLAAASEQGFDTSLCDVHIVDGNCIEIYSSYGVKRIYLNDEEESIEPTEINITDSFSLRYCDDSQAATNHKKLQTQVVIGECRDGSEFDHWQCNGMKFQLCSSECIWNRDSVERHLSWVVVALCLDFAFEDAMVLARASLHSSYDVSRETWPIDVDAFPEVQMFELEDKQTTLIDNHSAFTSMDKTSLGLYLVVDDVKWIERLLNYGLKTVQLRIKDPNQSDLENQITKAIELGNQFHAQVFINDYWQLAIKHRAYGVHLGQEDLAIADLNLIKKSGLRLGVSTHGYFEIIRAKDLNPSYIALGHIFPTTTKEMPSQPQGVTKLRLYQKLIGDAYPTVAIGGIDLSTAQAVWSAGVSSLAVVRAITQADDIQLAIDSFYQIMALKPSTPLTTVHENVQ
ncbi:thiamine phosphate synthase [Vibrio rumoiensis]|uniref:Thiamine-phosphate synthase n=1 Tax=Vibrio rumoiensis 1S-45 TaxID=1188252 RepID=A0A1E5E3U9_9VIBR|nr:thiamine phosphate synthase [Vibrio rumoiensis]OEF27185.1 thiamine-phosphate diphosphorylase [Vibrio rumoiensis 1S-45]